MIPIDLPVLSERPPAGHKGTFGHLLVVAGSPGMSGAAVLAGTAALRSGAGTVQVASPAGVQPIVAGLQSCFTTLALPETRGGLIAGHAIGPILEAAGRADAIVVGPGLGQGASVRFFVRELLEQWPGPILVDADALNSLAPLTQFPNRPGAVTVLTPHPGEMARLVGRTPGEVQSSRETVAREWAGRWGVVLVLKGSGSVVADGRRFAVNETGNPGMATGGSGDVLSGVIGALLAGGLSGYDAARLGTWVHGRAGDRAAQVLGQDSLIATDLLEYLSVSFSEVRLPR